MTDAAKLAADMAEAGLDAAAYEDAEVVLLATGTYGTAVTWEVLSGYATIDAGKLKYPYKGEAYVVEVKALFSLAVSGGDPLTDNKTYTINVAAHDVVTDLATLSAKEAGAWVVAGGGEIYIQGVVTGAYSSWNLYPRCQRLCHLQRPKETRWLVTK